MDENYNVMIGKKIKIGDLEVNEWRLRWMIARCSFRNGDMKNFFKFLLGL